MALQALPERQFYAQQSGVVSTTLKVLAAFVALVGWGVGWPMLALVSAVVGGVFGAIMDSVMGAAVQARRHCEKCNAMTEQKVHRCGATTDVIGGIHWIDNDDVNALATLYGALFGAAVATFL